MGVMVKMSNGDVERFEHATKYQSGFGDHTGYLYVSNEDGSQVAQFAPGGWSAVWAYPLKRPAAMVEGGGLGRTVRRQIDDDISVTVTVDGQKLRRIADDQIDKTMAALAESLARQAG